MSRTNMLATAALTLCLACVSAHAEEDYPFARQIEARESLMHLYAFNLGLLGAMAKGELPYNSQQSIDAVGNLLALARMKDGAMWPPGSDASAPGLAGHTRAKPELWTSGEKVAEKHGQFLDALTAMAAEAGNGLDSLRASIKAVGDGCKGCHESFRAPEED